MVDQVPALGVHPDLGREKDYLVYVLDGVIAQPTGVWLLRSRIDSTLLERHFESILERVEERHEALRQLAFQRQLQIEIICLWVGNMALAARCLMAAEMLGRSCTPARP